MTEKLPGASAKSGPSLEALKVRWKDAPQLAGLLEVAWWLVEHLPSVEAARDLRHLQAQVEEWADCSFKRGLATATVSSVRLEVVAGGRVTTSAFHPNGSIAPRLKRSDRWTTVIRGAADKGDYEVELDEPHAHISRSFNEEVDRAAVAHGLQVNPVATDVAFAIIERFAVFEAKAKKSRPPSVRQLFAELMVAAGVALVRPDGRALREDMNSEDLRLLALASGFEGAPGSGQTRASPSLSSERTLWRLKLKQAQETYAQVLNFYTSDAATVAEVSAATEAGFVALNAGKKAPKRKASKKAPKPKARAGKTPTRSRRIAKAPPPR